MTCRSLRAFRLTEPGNKCKGPCQCITGAFREIIRDRKIADECQRDFS